MALMIALGIVVALAVLPIIFSVRNPVVNVVDDLTTTTPYSEVDAELAVLLGTARGYRIQMLAPGTYSLSYRRAPAWALVLALFTFPLGILIIVFARETLTLSVSATAISSGTRVLVLGRTHRKFARAVGTAVQLRLERLRSAGSRIPPELTR